MKNVVFLIGRIGSLKFTKFEDGSAVNNISLAIEDNYYNSENQLVERTHWIDVVARNKTAELIDKYFNKGDQLGLQGKLTKRKFTTDKGDVYITEVQVEKVEFKASQQSKENAEAQQKQQQQQQQ